MGIDMVSDILKGISDLDEDKLQLFIYCLNFGFENEWDCNLVEAVKIFGSGKEWCIAAKGGIGYAIYVEENK